MLRNLIVFFFSFMSFGAAFGVQAETVVCEDCNLSFSVPSDMQYIRVLDAKVSPGDVCYLAFNYAGALKRQHTAEQPSMPDDWRAQVDLVITFKKIPLVDQVKKVESFDGGSQSGIFRLMSKDRIDIVNGTGYIYSYSATKPTASMRRLRQSKEVVFVVGDGARSAIYFLYPSGENWRQRMEVDAFKNLFSSFRFAREAGT